jgi:PAS domain S-box-containing protein
LSSSKAEEVEDVVKVEMADSRLIVMDKKIAEVGGGAPLSNHSAVPADLLQSLLRAVSYGVIVLDAEQRVVLWSGWMETASGFACEAVRGRTLGEIFPELAGSRILAAVHSALQQGFSSVLSQSLNKSPFPLFAKVSPTGSPQRIQQKVTVRPLGQMRPVASCLVEVFDVSLAVHREKILEEKKSFLNTILDSEPECVMVLSAEGDVAQMNKAGLAMFEVENLEILRRKGLVNFVSPAHQDRFAEMVRQVFSGHSGRFEFEIAGNRGAHCWLDTNATPLCDAKGAPVGLLAVSRDITQSKQAAAELEKYRQHLEELVEERTFALSIAKEAAEAASRAKSTFLANMSHELRTPMHAIMGMTSLALRRATEPKQADQLSKVAEAAQRLLGIINNILDISKIEAERLNLEKTDFTLRSVLDQLSNLTSQKAAESGLKFIIEIDPELAGRMLRGDPLRLGQVLLNLASNAIKFTATGGVTVRVHCTAEYPDHLALRLEVQDSGIGVQPDDQQRLFTAFEQADGSTTRKYGGTGLGLAISKRLVEMMGGHIGVDSRPGAGSTFWFTVRLDFGTPLDAQISEDIVRSAEEHLKASYPGTYILLVEDEPVNREVARGLLEDLDFRVDVALDGVEAVEMARQTAYDMILMDMQMPRMNGVAATQAIRRLPGRESTPILAMTANAFEEDRQACLAAGMNDHIAKPVELDVFFETVLKWLARTI